MSEASEQPEPAGSSSEIILYQTEDRRTQIDVRLEGETVWLSQSQMAELFQTTPQNITIHIKNIYEEGELGAEGTCKDYLQVQREGSRDVHRSVTHYNLDVMYAQTPDHPEPDGQNQHNMERSTSSGVNLKKNTAASR